MACAGLGVARPAPATARATDSKTTSVRPNAWHYRDWVVDALNRDLPYDEFARLQLAGDVLRPEDPGRGRGDRVSRRRGL